MTPRDMSTDTARHEQVWGGGEMIQIAREDIVLLAIDVPVKNADRGKASARYQRAYFLGDGTDYLDGKADRFVRVTPGTLLAGQAGQQLQASDRRGGIAIVLYPTKTYSQGASDTLFTEVAPEDRAMIRRITRLRPDRVRCYKIPLQDTAVFEELPDYFEDDAQRKEYRAEREARTPAEERAEPKRRRFPVGFDVSYLKTIVQIFKSCITRPSRLDYFYLVTKTFAINFMVRLAFAFHGVAQHGLAVSRAAVAMIWYTLQDAVMTIYGQTYMKFLGRLTGMLRVGDARIGDFLFVYVQYCVLEFLNRLIIGPVGENPPAYTWRGVELILLNNLQGLISGGPLTPAINKMREKGFISYKAMMNLYQVSSLTFYFGLFASFGHQTIYAILTGGVMIFAWGSYLALSFFFKDPEFQRVSMASDSGWLSACAEACYRRAAGLAG
jgi:hypothetical protein